MISMIATDRIGRLALSLSVVLGVSLLVQSRAEAVSLESLVVPGQTSLTLAAGTYTVGPDPLILPANFTLSGSGPNTVVDVVNGTASALALQSGDSLANLTIDASAGSASTNPINEGVIYTSASNVSVKGVQVNNSSRSGIYIDHGNYVTVQGCTFQNLYQGIGPTFSNNVTITGNTMNNMAASGVEVWGNWNWQTQASANFVVSGNTATNCGAAGFWGTGVTNFTMNNNVVNGAGDVGVDMEWCTNGTISGNTVHKAASAGVSLFYSCNNVQITGNTVYNDYTGASWSESGIWLTSPNTSVFAGDTGNQNVTITGNTVVPGTAGRRAMWIGTAAQNVAIGNNGLQGNPILVSGGNLVALEGQPANVGFHAFSAPATTSAHANQSWGAQSLDCRGALTTQIDKIAGTFAAGATGNVYSFHVYNGYNGKGGFSGSLYSWQTTITPNSATTILDFTGAPLQLTGSSNGIYYLEWTAANGGVVNQLYADVPGGDSWQYLLTSGQPQGYTGQDAPLDIYTTTVLPVPEPTSFCLLLAAGLATAGILAGNAMRRQTDTPPISPQTRE